MQTNIIKRRIISVDAMGGDRGPGAVVLGLSHLASENDDVAFILHGDKAKLTRLVERRTDLAGICEIRHADEVVAMDAKPSQVMRNGKNTSMASAIEAVKQGEAEAVVSCGNTGALMALSMIRLRKLPGIIRPAIAILWPSRNAGGFNVVLDVGADVRADGTDLMQYALMGASYARNGLRLKRPRIGLLNVGTEENKGHPELKTAHALIGNAAEAAGFEFIGFVEGSDIPSSKVDVIVTDGFTGNIALKTAEGTASLSRDFLREAFKATWYSRLSALFAMAPLKRMQRRIDPRRVNGGVFLGLNGTVIKSHGGADATGVAAAVGLALDLARSDFSKRLAARVASVHAAREGAVGEAKQSE